MVPDTFLVLAMAFVVISGGVDAQENHSWNLPPSEELLRTTAGLVHESFQSDLMETEMGYCVVLPSSYEKEPTRRYPVVLWLHGGGGNECSSVWTSQSWRGFDENGEADEVILAYPNAGRSSYWDHDGGKILMESVIMDELIPHLDANYRTIASRDGRAVHGFSMGASGALKFAIRYPDRFCCAVAYGGGAIDLELTQMPFVKQIIQRNLNDDPVLIRKNNTYRILATNQERLRKAQVSFLLICGKEDPWKDTAISFDRVLRNHGLQSELHLVPGVAHDIRGLMEAQGAAAVRFQNKVFQSFH